MEIVTGEAQTCNLSIGNNNTIQINLAPTANTFPLDFSSVINSTNETQVTISDSCNATSREVVFTYENATKIFNVSNSFTLNSPGCFGSGLKSACDPESTAYALYAMNLDGFSVNDESEAISWLQNNVNSIDQVAILYSLENDSSLLNQVLSSQNYDGAWQKNGVDDIRTTAIVYYVLLMSENKTNNMLTAMGKASDYLSNSLGNQGLNSTEE